MLGKVSLFVCALVSLAKCDWVEIPQISSVPKVTYKIQTVASFADLPESSVLGSSNVLSSVFSYDPPLSTTEATIFADGFEHKSTLKKYFPTTVTSKTFDVKHKITDRVDYEEIEMEPVKLMQFESDKRKVAYANQTVPMKVLPIMLETGKTMTSTQHSEEPDDDDDDGVTIVDDDEELDITKEQEDEYYYYDEPTSSTTTQAPRKVPSRKPPPPKPQRRIIEMMNMKAKVHNHLSFSSFLKFLKNIQQSFATRTAKNISDKIKMLSQFRDSLLVTINQRIKSLWKTQSKKKKKHRSKRTLMGGGGGWMEQGGMDFPSAEGALLSISFLTFAVFLIKLVLVSDGVENFSSQAINY